MTPAGRVRVVAERAGGRTAIAHLESAGLTAARPTPWGLYLVSAGAHPLDGDVLEVDLRLEAGAELEVRSVGALLARRAGPSGTPAPGPSRSLQRAVIGPGARLAFLPDPCIAAGGATHRSQTAIELAGDAELAWREEVVLGRAGEDPPGTWWSERRVELGGRPLLVSEVGLGPGAPLWRNGAVTAGARALSSLLLAGPGLAGARATTARAGGAWGAALPLEGPAVELVALGGELTACRRLVEQLASGLGAPWGGAAGIPAAS